MNTIERVKIVDDRLYLKILFDAVNTVDLRFYLPARRDEFIERFRKAINNPTLAMQRGNWEDREEEFLYETIIKSAMGYLEENFNNFYLTGVFQKKWLQFTNLTREYFVIYMHSTVIGVDIFEVFPSLEEAVLTMIQWKSNEEKLWRFEKRKEPRTTYDALLPNSLCSIDRFDHFLMYKALCPNQLEYLVKKGLITLTR